MKDTQDLILQAVYQTISAEDFQALQEILARDEAARLQYLTAINLSQTLREEASQIPRLSLPDAIALSPAVIELSDAKGIFSAASKGTIGGPLTRAWLLAIAAALMAVTSAFLWFSRLDETNRLRVAQQSEVTEQSTDRDPVKQAVRPDEAKLYLASVRQVSEDVAWGHGSAKPDFALRNRRGDRIHVKAGLVQLQYFTGAEVLLHGPCVFVITGERSGRLERGRVTGKVEGGNFALTTPSAKVIDLGTEFGILVSRNHVTNVHVFDGEVRIDSDESLTGSVSSLSLTQGMSARVNPIGLIREQQEMDVTGFERNFISKIGDAGDRISLVDLLSSAADGRFGLSGVIAPDTGKADQGPWLRSDGPGHRLSSGYENTAWNPFVDGVFVPSVNGSRVKINSGGDRVDLPDSNGRTWGPIWSRRKMMGTTGLTARDDFWGMLTLGVVNERLSQCETGMIGLHANVGVTFDLDAVRKQGWSPESLHLIVGNLDNSLDRKREWALSQRFSADIRVYVDGKLKSERLDFTREDGEFAIDFDLANENRFLTLVSSDAGRDGFDHVVLIDPFLKLRH